MVDRRSCSECPGSFELTPPADSEYCVPKEKPSNDDHIRRIYECEDNHINTIYWHKKEFIFKDIPP
jgi:hypothetical protein